jgi:hypothetical protein
MKLNMDESLTRFKWHILVVCMMAVALLLTAAGAVVMLITKKVELTGLPLVLWAFGAGVFTASLLATVFAALLLTYENVKILNNHTEELGSIISLLNKNRQTLSQLNQTVRLSETAKEIVFGETVRQALTEVVKEKLHQQDFQNTYRIIEDISRQTGYGDLAEQLRLEADRFRDASEEERANQFTAHIEKLFEQYQWAKASAQIDRLVETFDEPEKGKYLRQRLLEKKEQRKKELLAAWDEMVKRHETDRSLEILKELDLYLTPNEGLALQESAKDVFRTKLHNLGVKFSLAVTDKQWEEALQTGEQIIRDFPNSRMAQEIRGKIDILRQRTKQAGQ